MHNTDKYNLLVARSFSYYCIKINLVYQNNSYSYSPRPLVEEDFTAQPTLQPCLMFTLGQPMEIKCPLRDLFPLPGLHFCIILRHFYLCDWSTTALEGSLQMILGLGSPVAEQFSLSWSSKYNDVMRLDISII